MEKRKAKISIAGIMVLVLSLSAISYADTYKLIHDQGTGGSWDTLGDWTNTVAGTPPTAILPADDYDMDGFILRSPTGASPSFGAGSLTSSSVGGVILFKHTAGTASITNFNEFAGVVFGAGNPTSTQSVHLVGFSNNIFSQLSAGSAQGVDVQIDNWTGNGILRMGNATSAIGYYGLTITDALGFTGTIDSTFGTTDWKNDADLSNASYKIVTAGYEDVILNSDITVKALTIGGTGYGPGTYSFATLNAAHDSTFVDGGAGSITVLGESKSYKLIANQGSSQSWDSLGDWTNTVDGTPPTAILPIDHYDMDGFVLRSPTGVSPTFGAGSLTSTSSGGAILFKHSSGTATITSFNDVIGVVFGAGNAATQSVHLVGFSNHSYAQLSADPDRGMDVQIDNWTGNGILRMGNTTSSTGYYGLTITDALGFTGTIDSTFGTTDWKNDADLSNASYKIVTAGYEDVILNSDIRVGALDIGGTIYAPGTYSFAMLNAAHDSSFVDGGTGSIAVGLGSLPSYVQWANQYPTMGSETNKTDDPDLDGLNNLYEWGLGGDPTNGADLGHIPTFGIIEDSGTNWFEYLYAKRNDSDDLGLDYYLELLPDLVIGSWASNNYVVGIGTLDAEFDTVTNRIPTDAEDEQFIKLMIESN